MEVGDKSTSFGERHGHRTDDMAFIAGIGGRADRVAARHLRGPPTPSMPTPSAEFDQQLSIASPPPPPTPAASPGPSSAMPEWREVSDDDDEHHVSSKIRRRFKSCSGSLRIRILTDLIHMCTSQQLSFIHQLVSPMLKMDPFTMLPDELCLRVLSFIDDPKVMLRASQVSRRWRDLLSDEMTWKALCCKHDYFREIPEAVASGHGLPSLERSLPCFRPGYEDRMGGIPLFGSCHFSGSINRQKYLIEAAWRSRGTCVSRNITQEVSVVTSLHLTPKYIIVALDNARIHVFDRKGNNQKVLQGHVMGVWAMVPWDDVLVSGGCDRDVRVWDLVSATCLHTLHGHTSTVRCLKMFDANTAISGSRDTTLRVWDIRTGLCRTVLVGHQASVRCLEIQGDIVVSGSYDTTAKVWSVSRGCCLQTLHGHFSQIYAVAFDGRRVVTGSLDTNVRVWDPFTGECLSILQGHTSLVGQLQLRGDMLVTGGSDGSVRVWSLQTMAAVHRLAAHDNSVTTLQFDDARIVSGGSDGRVKIWDLKTGQLVRELSAQCEAVWRVAFEAEKCVVLAQKQTRTVMEVWAFTAPPEDSGYLGRPSELCASEGAQQQPLSAPTVDYLLSQEPPHMAEAQEVDNEGTEMTDVEGSRMFDL